ncbi:MAG: sigma 54-interacting transcriptional regulator, partial [Bacteroidales bacterium]|nr:sigma 54-interacting transcriptional regulator [Bacteroidales bacterium]
TIFLDEIADMPLSTQARLLRVLESGEFIKVGSSKVLKTDVRVIAATNVNVSEAIHHGKFREDLYYRLSSVPIIIPPLRERKDDILLLFRKFAADFAEKYKMPSVTIEENAQELMLNYRWPGNIRQLKNIAEQISIIEKQRKIDIETLTRYLPQVSSSKLPVLMKTQGDKMEISERDILYRVLFEMRKDITELKQLVAEIMKEDNIPVKMQDLKNQFLKDLEHDYIPIENKNSSLKINTPETYIAEPIQSPEIYEESLSIQDREVDLIKKALDKHRGKRKNAARELGISERTLYRKIKEYNIDN